MYNIAQQNNFNFITIKKKSLNVKEKEYNKTIHK